MENGGLLRLSIDVEKERILFHDDAMSSDIAVFLLRVVVRPNVADVLTNMSSQSHCQRLNAATDAEDGQLTVVGQLGDK